MKISISRILLLCVIFIATALIVSCGKPQSVVVETPPTEKKIQKPSKAELTEQRAKQGFSELDAETDESKTPKHETPRSNLQEKTTFKEPERLTEKQKKEGWVEVTGECYQGPNMTAEEAQRRALKEAECNAIEQTLGVMIRAQMFLLKSETPQGFYESFTELSQSTVYGRIIDKKKPIWAPVENVQFRPGEPPIPLYRVRLRAKVAREKGEPDPGFTVSLELNGGRETFFEGDEMILHITPTQDCYITVFNVLSDNTVLVLFPLQGQTQRIVRAGQTLAIPPEAERRQGRCFRVGLLPGKTEDTESVIIVATKDYIPFLPREKKEFLPDIDILKGKVVLPTYQSALEEINRWLVSIPLNQRAFDMQQYHIRKK